MTERYGVRAMGPSDMLEQCVLCGRSERRVRTTSSERLGSRNGVRETGCPGLETGASERGADVYGATECDGGERDVATSAMAVSAIWRRAQFGAQQNYPRSYPHSYRIIGE